LPIENHVGFRGFWFHVMKCMFCMLIGNSSRVVVETETGYREIERDRERVRE